MLRSIVVLTEFDDIAEVLGAVFVGIGALIALVVHAERFLDTGERRPRPPPEH